MQSLLVTNCNRRSILTAFLLLLILPNVLISQSKTHGSNVMVNGRGDIVATNGIELKTLSGGIREPVRMVLESPANARNLYAVTSTRMVVSANRGDAWSTALAFRNGEVPRMVGILKSSPNLVYCEVEKLEGTKAYYLSRDGGRNWIPVLNTAAFTQFMETEDWIRPG